MIDPTGPSGTQPTIAVVAGRKTSGEAVIEQVLVEPVDGSVYRIRATPALVLGCAAGDVVAWDRNNQTISIIARGGNLAVQVYGPDRAGESILDEVTAMGGGLDGKARNLTVYTIPATAGFPAVENMLNSLAAREPGIEWYFGNVDDPVDEVTPLDWW
jgi:hypothetical protein